LASYSFIAHTNLLLTELIQRGDTKQQVKKLKKVNLSLCFKWAPRHHGVLGEWRYSSKYFWPRH